MSLHRFASLLFVALGSVPATTLHAQATNAQTERELKRSGLAREALAGQRVAVMPLTHLVRDSALADSGLRRARTVVLTWADSLLAETLAELAAEIDWVFPTELRKTARKAVGMIPEPDRMGPSVMRSPQLKTVPDPLRGNLRTLMGLVGGRYVFIPASVAFAPDTAGKFKATLAAVLADSRTGQVGWRASNAAGVGATPGAALRAAVATFLPDTEKP
jgi:hypothetical protein